jgi:hypothetical protein
VNGSEGKVIIRENVMKHNNNKYAIIFDLVQVEDAVVF